MGRPALSVYPRLMANHKVSPSGCWEWTRARDKDGYGKIRVSNVMQRAHRVSYEFFNGEIPEGLIVRHKCDNPCCINPEHLEIGTHKDNTQDAIMRNRRSSKGTDNVKAKLTPEEVLQIYTDPRGCVELSKIYHVGPNAVSRIKRGISWQHVTQHEVSGR